MTSRKLHIGEVGGMLDRSPCGSGTAAIVTSNWYRGDFKIGSCKLLNLYLVDANTEITYFPIMIASIDTSPLL